MEQALARPIEKLHCTRPKMLTCSTVIMWKRCCLLRVVCPQQYTPATVPSHMPAAQFLPLTCRDVRGHETHWCPYRHTQKWQLARQNQWKMGAGGKFISLLPLGGTVWGWVGSHGLSTDVLQDWTAAFSWSHEQLGDTPPYVCLPSSRFSYLQFCFPHFSGKS